MAGALLRVLGPREAVVNADALAMAFQQELRAAGYALHDVERCVRPPKGDTLGRPMTEAEQALVQSFQRVAERPGDT
jgi:hypothetical protein